MDQSHDLHAISRSLRNRLLAHGRRFAVAPLSRRRGVVMTRFRCACRFTGAPSARRRSITAHFAGISLTTL
jgi:predicted ATPase